MAEYSKRKSIKRDCEDCGTPIPEGRPDDWDNECPNTHCPSRLRTDGGYPWNVEIDVEGVTFSGPGMSDRGSAEAIANLVSDVEGVDQVDVVKNE